jgi:hypothetical protein
MLGWFWAFLLGIGGALVGAGIGGVHPLPSALNGGFLGAILGAILGGTHEIVGAVRRMTKEVGRLQEREERPG